MLRAFASMAVFAVLLAACGGSEEAEQLGAPGAGRVTSDFHAWNGYHWARTSKPFVVTVGDNVSSAWDGYLATASRDWTASSVLDMVVGAGGTRPRTCKATSGRVEVCNAKYGSNGWLGVATVWVSGTHITAATVKLNDTYFTTSRYDTPGWRMLVVCQEVGHALGLDHQDEIFGNANLGSCMDYTNDPDGPPGNLHPNGHDYDELEAIYAHLDSTTTLGQALLARDLPPRASGAAEDASEWGRLVRGSADGRAAVYVKDLGAGERVFTFVIRA